MSPTTSEIPPSSTREGFGLVSASVGPTQKVFTRKDRGDLVDYRCQAFDLRVRDFTFDNWGILPNADFVPCDEPDERLGELLPEDWDASYREIYRQEFQPSRFYRNAALLTNLGSAQPSYADQVEKLLSRLTEVLLEHSILTNGARYVVNNFDFVRHGHTLKSGWTGAIMNAFALAGLLKMQEADPCERRQQICQELTQGMANVHDVKTPFDGSPWITLRDSRNYLWFEEYPLPNGTGCRVQNGHNFSILALALQYRIHGDEEVIPLIHGGLTTIKENGLRFRVPGEVPKYSLMPQSKQDYAPLRAVKQCGQLYALTRDNFFRGLGFILMQDLYDSGFHELPTWATERLEKA